MNYMGRFNDFDQALKVEYYLSYARTLAVLAYCNLLDYWFIQGKDEEWKNVEQLSSEQGTESTESLISIKPGSAWFPIPTQHVCCVEARYRIKFRSCIQTVDLISLLRWFSAFISRKATQFYSTNGATAETIFL